MPPNKRAKLSHDAYSTTPRTIHDDVPPSAGTTLAGIYELMELILVQLPYIDILYCSQVSETWRAFIEGSTKLQILLYKTPTPISGEEPNPHFETASLAASTAVIPRTHYQGLPALPVLQTSQQYFEKFLDRVTGQVLCVQCADEAMEEYRNDVWWVRFSFRDVRIPNGWPISLQEIYCHMCEGFHTRLRREVLHPMLSFLEDVDTCWRGSGGKLLLDVNIVHRYAVPRSCWDDYMVMEIHHVKSLKKSIEVAECFGLQHDLCFKPMVTDLIISIPPNEWIIRDREPEDEREPRLIHIQNAEGVRLQQVLSALVFANKLGLWAWLESVHTMEPTLDNWDSWLNLGLRLDMSHRFPYLEDYAAYVEGWPDLVQRFQEVKNEIDGLMGGIEAWGWSEWPRKG
ncbi:uncharacterized protein N0V89_010352 [Didymosphaeria variabile]|uniref:F-box domain-containing protein n=1 Tax=Didymosphaeria variabile TaxID=1932322 RepID=A0A9W8XBL6_9PLEO|nr:uncharacterized protein N0V89_010352 [Didymosphaeria variabile]KAJ4346423.1 hypothetical protein N0V89_010352 [Didymosphaeria variabile]